MSLQKVFVSKPCLLMVFTCIILSVWFVYTSWPSSSFTKNSKVLYETEKSKKQDIHTQSESKITTGENEETPKTLDFDPVPVMITFTKAKHNVQLQEKFRITVNSILQHCSVSVRFYIIGDDESQMIAKKTITDLSHLHKPHIQISHLDVEKLATDLHTIVSDMQSYFSYKPGAYYSDALFFLSIAIHRVMPDSLHKVIMLDADLKFNADIKDLYHIFSKFKPTNIMGIARDNQPVYRHTFSQYRSMNPGTRVGGPPPDGLTGFNSGVLLLNLNQMRKSKLYNTVINKTVVEKLTKKYHFKGHLGDQDFFSLLSMEYEELFYVLHCSWNRQLCRWWEDKGYQDVFHSYFDCEGHINIYHGNCNTPIPKLDWEI